jgi:hypothetical protein
MLACARLYVIHDLAVTYECQRQKALRVLDDCKAAPETQRMERVWPASRCRQLAPGFLG